MKGTKQMEMRVFAIFDAASGAYMQPFFMVSRGAALRAFMDLADDPSSAVSKHPMDYTLFELASFDDQSGALVPVELANLGNAASLLQKSETSLSPSFKKED